MLFQRRSWLADPIHIPALVIVVSISSIFLLVPSSVALSSSSSSASISSTSMPSLGARVLADIVTSAARHDESVSLDVNGIMWLEHINLVVGSKDDAELFYHDFLGCSKDQSSSFHRNLGQQQFHLAENGDPAQVITGSVGLTVPSLDSIRERLPAASEALGASTKFEILEDSKDCMTMICPWGNRLHLYDIRNDNLESTSDSTQKMVKLHAEGGSYGPQRMAVRGQPGIRYIEIACPKGTSQAIANFYKEIFRCTVSKPTQETTVVCAGPGVHLVFAENKELTQKDMAAMKGVHICIYANDFEMLYRRLASRKLIWTNPRFTHLDRCDTWEEAKLSRTLRFKDVLDLSSGKKILELEHETRPTRHGQYLKVPHYVPR